MAPAGVQLEDVYKSFGERTVLAGISLSLQPGSCLGIWGPNGCGKTSLLNIIAGILLPDQGQVRLIGNAAGDTPIVGYVPQNPLDFLFPWRTNLDNVGMPLQLRGHPPALRRARARALLDSCSLHIPPDGYPYNLSGGQQRLLTILQALCLEPDIILLDEPFSGLDYHTQIIIHEELQHIYLTTGLTTIAVSHTLEDLLMLAGRLMVLTKPPTRVATEIEVNLGYPRTPQTSMSMDFQRIRQLAFSHIKMVNQS